MKTRNIHQRKKGAILVLTAVFMLLMIVFLAFSIDLGYISMARTQLQRTADSSAIAATWSLMDGEIMTGQANSPYAVCTARSTAAQYAGLNKVLNNDPTLTDSDITVGYLSNPSDPTLQLNLSGNLGYNAIQVTVQRTAQQNGAIPLSFARVLGIGQLETHAVATAAFISNVSGFKTPSDGSGLGMLPFALDQESWDSLMAGTGSDNWRYDPETKQVTCGPDGIKEVNLFPQGTGSPGNRGTVDFGNPNNSTADIARQILDGVSHEDLSFLGGQIALNADGVLVLNGDTGISAGVKDELTQIKGQPKMLPLFQSVTGQGNNAQYTIVRFIGARIMEVKLTGNMNSKRVLIQPATVYAKGIIPNTSGTPTSMYIYSPVSLVR